MKKQTSKKSTKKSTKPATKRPYVVVRTYSAGVHCGLLVSTDGPRTTLTKASRIWRWRGANTLHEVSLHGVDQDYTRISEQVDHIELPGTIEVIHATAKAQKNLSVPRWGA